MIVAQGAGLMAQGISPDIFFMYLSPCATLIIEKNRLAIQV
jgi:hypothetical protein